MSITVNTAVLHILNFERGAESVSEESLNLEDAVIAGYVQKLCTKVLRDDNAREGIFHEDSGFLALLRKYEDKESNFTGFSAEVTESLKEPLKNVAMHSMDLLFADVRTDEEIPYLLMLFLENEKSYTHETGVHEDHVYNSITMADSLLPAPTKRVKTYAVINPLTNDIRFCDETAWNVSDLSVMEDTVLECSSGKSHKEVLKQVTDIAEDIAAEYNENPTIMLSRVKNYIRETSEEEAPITTEDLAVHVFNESDEMQNSFIAKSQEAELPEKVEVPKEVTSRKMKNQKIRTDTGITLSFPTEYFSDPSKIEFINHDDGTITIEIRHIGKITNRD